MNRKVLFIAPSAYPLGGVQTWLSTIMLSLHKRGWTPVIGLTKGRFHSPDLYLEHHAWQNVAFIDNCTGSRTGRIHAIRKTIEQVDPAIIAVVNIADAYEAFASLPERTRMEKRIVMTIHGLESTICREAKRVESACDAIVCTNRLTQTLLAKAYGVDETRLMYAPYGVKTGLMKQNSKRESETLQVLFAARIENDQKRVFDLPEIMLNLSRLLPNARLLVAGDGPHLKQLLEKVASSGLGNQVELLGHVSHEDLIHNLLPSSDVFLVTSSWETGPISIWEAMATGVPVVTSRYVGSKLEGALSHENNCLMFDVGDARDAAKLIERIVNIETLREKLVANAMKLVETRYSQAASADLWESCFTLIIESPSRRGACELGGKKTIANGRLDHLFGSRLGEVLRRMSQRTYAHAEPGGEWPHVGHGITVESDVDTALHLAATCEADWQIKESRVGVEKR